MCRIQEQKMIDANFKDCSILEGIVSISAAIKSGKREIIKVLADKKKVLQRDRKATRFISLLKENNISYTLLERSEIDDISNSFPDSGTSHGGFIAYVKERQFTEFSAFLDELIKSNSYAVYLDGVEDPFNFGYSLRSLFAFGAYGFIVPERNWMSSANVVSRSSAGASEMCNISIAPKDDLALEIIRSKGINIVCAGLSANSVDLSSFNCSAPFILFIGGEKRGISQTFFENADTVVHIPYTNAEANYSLPTASVAAIFGSKFSELFKRN